MTEHRETLVNGEQEAELDEHDLLIAEQVEHSLVTSGQRRIDLIWEFTQAAIAILITLAVIYVSVMVIEARLLDNAFFLIIGFYFSRTNHSAIGGTGRKPAQEEYLGR